MCGAVRTDFPQYEDIVHLAAGDYEVTVTDENGCEATATYTSNRIHRL
jgi:hypothetical protein